MGFVGAGLMQGLAQGVQEGQRLSFQRRQTKMNEDYYKTLGKKQDLENQMMQHKMEGITKMNDLLQLEPEAAPAGMGQGMAMPTQAPMDMGMGGQQGDANPVSQPSAAPVAAPPAPAPARKTKLETQLGTTLDPRTISILRLGLQHGGPETFTTLLQDVLKTKTPTKKVQPFSPEQGLVDELTGEVIRQPVKKPEKPQIHDTPGGPMQITTDEHGVVQATEIPGVPKKPEKPTEKYTNVQPDGTGGFLGLNKDTQQIEKVPMADGVMGSGQLTPQAREAAAQRYLIDGTLPPNLGRGAQGAANTTSILNQASIIAAAQGDDGESQRLKQLSNKASASALTQLTVQEAKMRAFEGTFRKNVDLVESLSKQVDRGGHPIINSWINAGKRAVAGDVALTKFDAALKGAVNEYAKIVSSATGGGVTAESEIQKVEALLSAAQTDAQVVGILQTMRQETQNRMEAFQEEKSRLRSSIGGGRKAKGSAAEPTPSALPEKEKPLDLKRELAIKTDRAKFSAMGYPDAVVRGFIKRKYGN